eukprot:355912-Chlamydomonas_euryale.AAC.9
MPKHKLPGIAKSSPRLAGSGAHQGAPKPTNLAGEGRAQGSQSAKGRPSPPTWRVRGVHRVTIRDSVSHQHAMRRRGRGDDGIDGCLARRLAAWVGLSAACAYARSRNVMHRFGKEFLAHNSERLRWLHIAMATIEVAKHGHFFAAFFHGAGQHRSLMPQLIR